MVGTPKLRARVGTLPRLDLDAVLGELFPAVNEGCVHVEVAGLLL